MKTVSIAKFGGTPAMYRLYSAKNLIGEFYCETFYDVLKLAEAAGFDHWKIYSGALNHGYTSQPISAWCLNHE